ncbi:MAG TPA: tRNA adenosine(34) deaminase TadA [Candidatus Binatia bacterium]
MDFCNSNPEAAAYMSEALAKAREAASAGEVPVGAVIVSAGRIISAGHNARELNQSPLAHAEILAIDQAARYLGSWRLIDCDLYVTLEPCIMCVGAMLQARLRRLVFGCFDPKAGAVKSLYELASDPRLNHRIAVTDGVLKDECAALLSDFFTELRERKKETRLAERWPSPVEGA